MSTDARKIYDEAIVIDGLSISNWESDAVFRRLRAAISLLSMPRWLRGKILCRRWRIYRRGCGAFASAMIFCR